MQITICLSALHDEWHAYPLNMCVPYSRETEILSDVESCAWDVPGRTGNLRLIRSQNQPLPSLAPSHSTLPSSPSPLPCKI